MSLNRRRIQRNVSSLLDWLGDIGGLFETFFVIFSVVINLYHYKTYEIHLVQRLYKKKVVELVQTTTT